MVTRHVTVSDVGKALHPGQVRGQDEGAAVMALGHTFMEQYLLDDEGRIRNLGAIDYRIPTSMDLPLRMESAVVENEDGPGPYGSKGMSEGALLNVAPAVAAAVRDATGVVIRDLPLTPGTGLAGAARRGGRRRVRGCAEASRDPVDDLASPEAVTYAYALDAPLGLSEADTRALLGGKAANLGVMARDLGLPVPPGFVITTEACRRFLAGGWPAGLDDELREQMRRRRGGRRAALRRPG